VARHAPDRLQEVFDYKQAKRDAITFQLEALHGTK